MGAGVSPAAVKPRIHEVATEPDSIEQEMTMRDMTMAVMQWRAPQNCDHAWFVDATRALDDHAARLYRQALCLIKLRSDAPEATAMTQTGTAQIAQVEPAHHNAIGNLAAAAEKQHASLDTSLRGHVVEEIKKVAIRIDGLANATKTSGAITTVAI